MPIFMSTFLKESEILPYSIWEAADGSGIEVTVSKIENGKVYYFWRVNGGIQIVNHNKDVFSFQVRYKLKGHNYEN